LTEQEAIAKIDAGDTEAFGALYDLFVDSVYRFIFFRTHHRETAEDLTSQVFTKAFTKISSFDRRQKFGPWIFRIARNSVIDHWRTHKSTVDLEEAFEISSSTNIQRDFELQEKLKQAQKILNSLPPDHRELVVMRLWDGLSYAEIAAITGRSEANLRVAFSRIMARIHKESAFAIILFLALSIRFI